MGFELRREIRDLLPRGGVLTDKECRLILELADNANETTRRGWPGIDWLAEVCDIPNPKRVGEFLTSIARKWWELRVEIGKDKNGKPYYAKSGQKTVYRLPTRAELVERHGEKQVPPTPGLSPCKDPAKEGAQVPPLPGAQVPAKGGPFSSGSPQSSTSKNSSSLSPREDNQLPAVNVPAPRTERETEEAPPTSETQNPVARMLLNAGCPEDQLNDVRQELTLRHQPRSNAWWRTVHREGDLPTLVADVLEALKPAPKPISTLEWKATVSGEPECPCGEPGGNLPRPPDGWMTCASCRKASGWTHQDSQPRTKDEHINGRHKPYRDPVDMAAYDDWSAITGKPVIRSPADRVLADAQPLYEKYKAQETGLDAHGNGWQPGSTRHRLTDSRG